jgi:hypothetical protein
LTYGTTAVSTKTVTTYGSVATLTATVKKNVTTSASESEAIEVIAKDSNGNVVPSVGLTITSGTTATVASFTATSSDAAQAKAGTASVAVSGVAAGTSTLTIADTSTGKITTTAVVTVGADEAATVTMAFDKTTYTPGEKMILTLTAKDSKAGAVGDSSTASSLSFLSSFPVQGTLPSATDFKLGKQAITLYAPASGGSFSITATLTSGAAWSSTLDGTTVSATASVVDANQTSLLTQIDALNAKIVALNALIAKIMKKLGVK